MLRQVRIVGIAAVLALGLGSALAAQADAKRPTACITKLIIDRQEDDNGNVFRTVHVGDEVDALDPDDLIDTDVVTGFNRGTLVFIGDGAKYRARYHGGAC